MIDSDVFMGVAMAWQSAPIFGTEQLERWQRSVGLSKAFLWLLWIGSCLAFWWVIDGDKRPCSIEDLTICGFDSHITLAKVLVVTTLGLILWMPIAGCLTGVCASLLFLASSAEIDSAARVTLVELSGGRALAAPDATATTACVPRCQRSRCQDFSPLDRS